MAHSDADVVSTSPRGGGCKGTYLMTPPAIWILLIYLHFRVIHKSSSLIPSIILVKEWLDNDDLVFGLNKSHKRTEHALIGARGDGNLGLWVQRFTKERRVRIRNSLLQPRSTLFRPSGLWSFNGFKPRRNPSRYLRRRILIAIHLIQRLFGSIEHKLRWVISTDPFSAPRLSSVVPCLLTRTLVPY